MDAFSEALCHRLFRVHAKDVFDAWADKCVSALSVQYKNHIGETVYKPTREFLLFVQAALDLAARSDVHQRALITDNLSCVIPNCCCSVEANNGLSIFADQNYLASFHDGLAIYFSTDALAEILIQENFRDF